MEALLWYLLAGSRGGLNRLRILELLRDQPLNAHQMSNALDLDYRTTRHHLDLLVRNGVLVKPIGERYGSVYVLGGLVQQHWPLVEEIRGRGPPRSISGSSGAGSGSPRPLRRGSPARG